MITIWSHLEDVRANCFCASLLCTQSHSPRHAWERALSNNMNNDRADGHCYSFAWIKRSWTYGDPYFSFDGSFSLPIFYVWRKNKENLSTRSLNFLQNAPSNSVLCSSSFICATVSIASWRAKFCENVGKIGIIYATEPLLQNITKVVCLRWLTFDIFNYKPL